MEKTLREAAKMVAWEWSEYGHVSDGNARELKAALDREADRPDFEKFGRLVYELIRTWDDHWFGDEISEDVMPLAVESGLAERVPFDPEIHNCDHAEPGDDIWVWFKSRERGA